MDDSAPAVNKKQAIKDEGNSTSTAEGNWTDIGRWVSMDAAAAEMEISRSTLERRLRKGEVEAVKQGHKIYVLVYGPEPVSDAVLLETARNELAESERTVAELRKTETDLRQNIGWRNGQLEDARRVEAILIDERNNLSKAYLEEREAYRYFKLAAIVLSVSTIVSLLLILIAPGLSG